jgi:protein gp37
MSERNWKMMERLHSHDLKDQVRRKVFSGSMCDVFDKNAPIGQRERLWEIVRLTPLFHWQLLTKRAPNISRYLPEDWGSGYENVWLGVTVEDQKHGLKRMEALKRVPAKVRFISVEPLIEDLGEVDLSGIDWVIVGGESGHHARPMEQAWVERIYKQSQEQNVPFFFKQWGGRSSDKGGSLFHGEEVKEWPEYYMENL